MGSFALDEDTHTLGMLKGKPFFLIITAGMPKTAWRFLKKTISHLPVSLQYFGASVLGTHFEGGCTLGRGVFGLVVDKRSASLQTIKNKGVIFAKRAERFKRTGRLPLFYVLFNKFVRLSQQVKKKIGI